MPLQSSAPTAMVAISRRFRRYNFMPVSWALIGALCLLACGAVAADNFAAPLVSTSSPAPQKHIALILPTSSSAYGDAATAVREGFMAGYRENSEPGGMGPIAYYATDGSPSAVLMAYQQAVHEGASLIVGPLTRDGVTALSRGASISIPTLVLNQPEEGVSSRLFYTFGVKSEDEIRQLAQLLKSEGRHKIAIVTTRPHFFLRLADLLADEWHGAGGTTLQTLRVSIDSKELSWVHSNFPPAGTEAVFLSADARDACLIRPFIDSKVPVYTTSHAYEGNGVNYLCPDLRGVRFLAMPYVLQSAERPPGEPAQPPALHQRFYALGLDAFLLADGLLHNSLGDKPVLAGATGTISLSGNDFMHELIPAEFGEDGNVHPLTPKPPHPAESPDQTDPVPRETGQ